jgi:quercetin dioxygenase-like cupin family protein
MVAEARPEQSEDGLLPAGAGWFVLNARDARWFKFEGRGVVPALQGRGDFPQLGMGLTVLEPGEPMAMYHWETDQEDFLLLSGEALLVIEGEERRLRQWDFVHCPPGTQHVIVGAGDGPCAAAGRRFLSRLETE